MMSKKTAFYFKITNEEKELLKMYSSKLQMNMSEYLRFLISLQVYLLDDERVEIIMTKKLILDNETHKKLLANLNKIGNNLNQSTRALNRLCKISNASNYIFDIKEAASSIEEIKKELSKTFQSIRNLNTRTIEVK